MANAFMHFAAAFFGVGIGMIGMNIMLGSLFGKKLPPPEP